MIFFYFLFLYNFVMSENLCMCHCGTRITIDEQLLEEREMWREKYNCLQRQATNDLGKLKENMYIECAAIMQKQFAAKESQFTLVINQKNAEIKELTSRVINQQASVKIKSKQNEILTAKARQLQEALIQSGAIIKSMRSKQTGSNKTWEERLNNELTALKNQIKNQYEAEISQKDAENEHLRHCVREFEKRFQVITPEVQKLKNTLAAKNDQVQQLQARLQRSRKQAQTHLLRTRQDVDEANKAHSTCRNRISKLQLQVDSLTGQLQAARRVKREVRVEPVYIDRPVEVQKVVEKIVQVEKVVNKYIQPTTFRDQQLEAELRKVKEDNALLLNELHSNEDKHIGRIKEYEQAIRQYEDNEAKYKREREELAKRLQDQEREMDNIHAFIEKRRSQAQIRTNQPEKITIHVTKDGKYQKTVERVASSSGIATQPNLKPPRRR